MSILQSPWTSELQVNTNLLMEVEVKIVSPTNSTKIETSLKKPKITDESGESPVDSR